MLRHLCVQDPLDQSPCQLLQDSALTDQVFGLRVALKELVNQLVAQQVVLVVLVFGCHIGASLLGV